MNNLNQSKPLASHSANYINMTLTREGAVWVYRPTKLTRLFIKIIKFLGFLALLSSIFSIMVSLLAMLFVASAGGLFIFLGNRIELQYGKGALFDTERRLVTVLREPLFNQSLKLLDVKTESVPFERIHSLQILQKRARMNTHPLAFHKL